MQNEFFRLLVPYSLQFDATYIAAVAKFGLRICSNDLLQTHSKLVSTEVHRIR